MSGPIKQAGYSLFLFCEAKREKQMRRSIPQFPIFKLSIQTLISDFGGHTCRLDRKPISSLSFTILLPLLSFIFFLPHKESVFPLASDWRKVCFCLKLGKFSLPVFGLILLLIRFAFLFPFSMFLLMGFPKIGNLLVLLMKVWFLEMDIVWLFHLGPILRFLDFKQWDTKDHMINTYIFLINLEPSDWSLHINY